MDIEIVFERGATIPFRDLPDRAIALDGYVQGPHIDQARARYSFDHHAGCVRHATLSTCEMVLDALRVGLDPTGFKVFINDIDWDTVLSTWLLARPWVARHEGVADGIRAAGRLDALGPADPGPGLLPAVAWALAPYLEAMTTSEWRSMDRGEVMALLGGLFGRLDRWAEAGAPREHPDMPPPTMEAEEDPGRVLHRGRGWIMVEGGDGLGIFRKLYRAGELAVVVTRALEDGTRKYTIAKASEFVAFPIPEVLDALRRAEAAANPDQDEGHSWGGGSTIGGSPRNPDGSSSALGWEEVARIVEQTLEFR